ncbi:unnamed protein product [Rodentolepis nana]|uniref:STAR_dimer domain-containing protein n=1 Tax=Rodentolepis nana TaxID=102285 RepID=A0A158QI50_RODNA|nr:unnamed protein product [Rodentolepis nana]
MDIKEQTEVSNDSQNDDNLPPSEKFNPSLMQKATPEYLQELLLDKKTLQNFPNTFKHLELILEKVISFGPLEIAQVRERLFHKNGSIQMNSTDLPDPSGQIVTLQRKVFIPVKENPTLTLLTNLMQYQLQQFALKARTVIFVSFFQPEDKDLLKQTQLMELAPEGADDVKKQQLMELAIMNGTYREPQQQNARYHNNNSSSQHSSPSPLSPSLTFDEQDNKERQQAQVQQLTQQQQHQYLLQQQYLSMLSSQTALAALTQNPAAQLLSAAGLRFSAPTASNPASVAAAAANPLLLGATANSATPVNATTPNAATAAMNLAAVMGGMPNMPQSATTSAVNPQLGGAFSSEQLAALFGVANGTVSPNGTDASAAMAAAGFHGTFSTNSTAGANIIGDYSNSTDVDGSSGMVQVVPQCNTSH